MARHRGHKSLYEAMTQAKIQAKSKPTTIMERLRAAKVEKAKSGAEAANTVEAGPAIDQAQPAVVEHPLEPAQAPKAEPMAEKVYDSGGQDAVRHDPPRLWYGPRIIQLNAGKIEISIPYQVGIALLLGLVLVCLLMYRLGQRMGAGSANRSGTESSTTLRREPSSPAGGAGGTTSTGGGARTSAGSQGDHVIVIVEHAKRADLEPVRQHFAEFGIATQIATRGGKYLLVTQNTYDNPNTQGTNGYLARQKIVEVGARYKGRAPKGYEPFAPNYFKDAYGTKVK